LCFLRKDDLSRIRTCAWSSGITLMLYKHKGSQTIDVEQTSLHEENNDDLYPLQVLCKAHNRTFSGKHTGTPSVYDVMYMQNLSLRSGGSDVAVCFSDGFYLFAGHSLASATYGCACNADELFLDDDITPARFVDWMSSRGVGCFYYPLDGTLPTTDLCVYLAARF